MMTGGSWSLHSGEHFQGAGLLVCWFLRHGQEMELRRLGDSVRLRLSIAALTCGANEWRRLATPRPRLAACRRCTHNSLALEVAALAAFAMPPFEGEAVAGSGAGNFVHSSAASAMLRHSSCFNATQLSKVAFSRATPSRLRPMRAV